MRERQAIERGMDRLGISGDVRLRLTVRRDCRCVNSGMQVPGFGLERFTVVERSVSRYPVEPGRQARRLAHRPHAAQYIHPRLLEDVPGILLVTNEPANVVQQPGLPLADDLLDRGPVAAMAAGQQEFGAERSCIWDTWFVGHVAVMTTAAGSGFNSEQISMSPSHKIDGMPRALAIETSGRIGSVAVARDGVVLASDQFPHGLQHAAEILPRLDALCRGQGWSPGDLEQLYVSAGPGSFTGLRIGITLAKTLAFATGVQLVAVPSTDVLARNAPADAVNVIVVLDAKRDQIFTARFSRAEAGDWVTAEPARLDSLTGMLARSPRPVHLIGEGIPYHAKFLPPDDPGVIVTPTESWRARAEVVAALGFAMARDGMFAKADTLTPVYIRRPEAEEKWEAAGEA
jgi:tRNA threonylcarbamoyladenosine biosynthesis protein TsaB